MSHYKHVYFMEDYNMAYKFNLGTFNLGGTLDVEASTGADINLPNNAVDNDDLAGSIDQAKLAGSIPDSKLNAISTSNKVQGSAIELGSNSGLEDDSGLKVSLDGASLSAGAGGLSVAASQTEITSIKNAALVVGAASGNDHIDFSVGGTITVETNNVARITVIDATTTVGNNLVVTGDLTVNGTTTTVNSTTINVSQSFTFEGPADDHETTLHVGTPTQDLQVNLPQFSASAGAATYHLPVLADATTAAAAAVTAAEFALLDGGSSIGNVTLLDGDGFLHNDNGVMKHTEISKIVDLAFGKTNGDVVIAANGAATIQAGSVEGTMLDANVADDSTLELISNELRIKDNGVTLAKMAGLADGKFILGSAGGDPAAVSMSGDATMNNAGLLTIAATAVEGSMLNDNCISGQADFGSDANDILDADEFLISNGGVLNRIDASVLKTYFQTGVTADSATKLKRTVNVNGPTLNSGFQVISDDSMIDVFNITASATAQISGSWNEGDMVTIKGGSQVSTTVKLTVSSSAGYNYTYDGQPTLTLESAHAAVDLIYISGASGNDWIIL